MTGKSSQVFIDTAFVYALINTHDEWHERAVLWQARLATQSRALLTTEFVLMEIGDGLARLRFRHQAEQILTTLRLSALLEVVPSSHQLFEDAMSLYTERGDKNWGMTDCSSFAVMRRRGLSEALTVDRHFQQAGFQALLLTPA